MHRIDIENWSRREHYEYFLGYDKPHFSMCANVDVTEFRAYISTHRISLTIGIVYLLARTANDLPEFRRRLREDGVIEHDVVHPGYTLLVDEERFSFCTVPYTVDFKEFTAAAVEQIAAVKADPNLEDPAGDALLFMSAIPWLSFTSFSHPMHYHPADSVPRFAWGKIFTQGDRQLMPLDVLGHHALMDGLHVARYFAQLQVYLDDPGSVLDPI